MAASDLITELIECAFCLDKCTEPVGLPCMHTFCAACLNEHIEHTKTKTFMCPLCKAQFDRPDDGVDSFPKNFYFVQLLDILHQQEASGKRNCEKHKDRFITLFCNDCTMDICDKCVTMDEHKGHTMELTDQVYEQLTDDVNAIHGKLTSQKETTTKFMDQIELILTNLMSNIIGDIESKSTEAIRQINKWKSNTIERAKAIKESVLCRYLKPYNAVLESIGCCDIELHACTSPCYSKRVEEIKDQVVSLSQEVERLCDSNNKNNTVPKLHLTQDVSIDLGQIHESKYNIYICFYKK